MGQAHWAHFDGSTNGHCPSMGYFLSIDLELIFHNQLKGSFENYYYIYC